MHTPLYVVYTVPQHDSVHIVHAVPYRAVPCRAMSCRTVQHGCLIRASTVWHGTARIYTAMFACRAMPCHARTVLSCLCECSITLKIRVDGQYQLPVVQKAFCLLFYTLLQVRLSMFSLMVIILEQAYSLLMKCRRTISSCTASLQTVHTFYSHWTSVYLA